MGYYAQGGNKMRSDKTMQDLLKTERDILVAERKQSEQGNRFKHIQSKLARAVERLIQEYTNFSEQEQVEVKCSSASGYQSTYDFKLEIHINYDEHRWNKCFSFEIHFFSDSTHYQFTDDERHDSEYKESVKQLISDFVLKAEWTLLIHRRVTRFYNVKKNESNGNRNLISLRSYRKELERHYLDYLKLEKMTVDNFYKETHGSPKAITKVTEKTVFLETKDSIENKMLKRTMLNILNQGNARLFTKVELVEHMLEKQTA